MSPICRFHCCSNIFNDENEKPTIENSHILLYPGEYESIPSSLKKNHIIILDSYEKGLLASCDNKKIKPQDCNSKNNFKPLDCQSYPFFPIIINGVLKLAIDTDIKRCPLFSKKADLYLHYLKTFKKWEKLLKNKEIEDWIKSIKLEGFDVVEYERNK